MTITTQEASAGHLNRNDLWFTRCPVPTATGIAADHGWFDDEFGADGITVRSLQDAGTEALGEQHFAHGISTLIREGGNVPALWARSRGQATRLIGLTWIEERQAILTRADDLLVEPGQLVGRRLAIPRRDGVSIDFWRAMALHGFAGALGIAGRSLDDATLVEVAVPAPGPGVAARAARRSDRYPELTALVNGDVDAVYVKGAPGVEAAAEAGARAALELDAYPERRVRVNNGTPRPITVHQDLLDTRPEVVARFLAVLLRAADWAAGNPTEVARILSSETWSGSQGVLGAYRGDYYASMHPDLSAERLELLTVQKDFLLGHGFLESDFDVAAWADPAPLAAARQLMAAAKAS